jgi:hypothetical protein
MFLFCSGQRSAHLQPLPRAAREDAMSDDPLVWERVEWRQGDGRYRFEVERGGLHATLSAPHGGSLTLPMVAWEGLFDALGGARKTKSRQEQAFPPRSGARWYEGEAGELATAFRAGRSIRQLARAHNRTELAVEAQLERLGLWDRIERKPADAHRAGHQMPSEAAAEAVPFPSSPDRD